VREAMRTGLLGQIATPGSGHRVLPGVDWCADNAAYTGVMWNLICQGLPAYGPRFTQPGFGRTCTAFGRETTNCAKHDCAATTARRARPAGSMSRQMISIGGDDQ
jgi:hypothetical protein